MIKYLSKKLGKPKVASSGRWAEWENASKREHPFLFWLINVLEDLHYFFTRTLPTWAYTPFYFLNNWAYGTHKLPTGSRIGKWQELNTRMLQGIFTSLTNFVDMECAVNNLRFSKARRDLFGHRTWLRLGWRNPRLGLEYLGEQSESCIGYGQYDWASEVIELYIWWKWVYPNRPDPYEASGWNALYENTDSPFQVTKKYPEESRKALEELHRIEAECEAEDTEMLIRLVKVRNFLWT